MSASISKSKYLAGLQCPKLLWAHYNAKELIPAPDAGTQAVFDQGHEVGRLAQGLFPGGIEVSWEHGIDQPLKQTKALLAGRRPIYEASFSAGGVYARADILNPVADGTWDIVEVKSSTEVKPVNLHDVAVQRYCYEAAGVPIRRCRLMHINNQYVRRGAIDAAGLFAAEDVTGQLGEYGEGIAGRIEDMRNVIARKTCPEVDIGPHCADPYPCPLMDRCWAKVRQHDDNVFTIHHLGAKAWELYRRGILRNRDVPADFPLSDRQRIQLAAEQAGRMRVDAPAVRDFLATLALPLYLLDFETFQTAIPLLDESRPYQQVPFQFSLHVVDSFDAEPKHHSWLWDGTGDPRALMLATLKPLLGTNGSIVAYNAAFEKGVLQKSVEAFPKYAGWLDGVRKRTADLLAPFKSFGVYAPAQHGSASMKAVLPALTGKGYEDMAISDGSTASREFLRAMFAGVSTEERERVAQNLEEYCGLDTYGMLEIIWSLGDAAR